MNVDDLRNSRFLANSANFAPRRRSERGGKPSRSGQRTFGGSNRSRSNARCLGSLLEDPALALEYADRIAPRPLSQRGVSADLRAHRRPAHGTLRDSRRRVRGSARTTTRRAKCSRRSGSATAARPCGTATRRSGARIWTGSSSGCARGRADAVRRAVRISIDELSRRRQAGPGGAARRVRTHWLA